MYSSAACRYYYALMVSRCRVGIGAGQVAKCWGEAGLAEEHELEGGLYRRQSIIHCCIIIQYITLRVRVASCITKKRRVFLGMVSSLGLTGVPS